MMILKRLINFLRWVDLTDGQYEKLLHFLVSDEEDEQV